MLELSIRCKCKICGEPLVIHSFSHPSDLYGMDNNRTRETPFFVYHHRGFNEDGGVAIATCDKCGAEYRVNTGVISVTCSMENVDEDRIGETVPEPNFECSKMTFPKWLKTQNKRNDAVGDLARDAFWASGRTREEKKHYDEVMPGKPKKATDHDEWVKFLENKAGALTAFYMAWAEYQFLKEHCRLV